MDIADIKKKFVEFEVELKKDDAWSIQGTWVMRHKALERLAGAMNIRFDDPREIIVDPEHVVLWVRGYVGSGDKARSIWSYGEASMREKGSNYRVSGRQAAYIFAMAEKRACDRVILKLAGLHGAYSEDEADEFKESDKKVFPKAEEAEAEAPAQKAEKPAPARARATEKAEQIVKAAAVVEPDDQFANLSEEQREIINAVAELGAVQDISDYMMSPEVQDVLKASNERDRNMIRGYAHERVKALGWLAPKGQKDESQ